MSERPSIVHGLRRAFQVRHDLESYRHRIRPGLPWLLLLIGFAPFAARLDEGGMVADRVVGSESALANALVEREFDSPWSATAVLVISGLTLPADSDSGRAELARILEPVRLHPSVRVMLSPANSLDSLLVGTGGGSAIALVGITEAGGDVITSLRDTTAALGPRFTARNPRLALRWTGEPFILADLHSFTRREVRRAEIRALPVTALVAVWAFGSIVLAGGAFFVAFVASGITLGLAGVFTMVGSVPPFATALVPLIGLALAVDYSLYLVRGSRAVAESGSVRRTIWLAVAIVGAGFLGIALAPTAEIRAAGALCAIVALVAAGAATAFSPEPDRKPLLTGAFWSRWGAIVVRRPLIVLAGASLPVTFLAARAFDARLRTPLEGWLPAEMESASAIEDLRLAGRLPLAASLRIVVDLGDSGAVFTPRGWEAIVKTGEAIDSLDGVAAVRSIATVGTRTREVTKSVLPPVLRSGMVSLDERHAILDVVLDRDGATRAGDIVHAIRDHAATRRYEGTARALVTGLPAYAVDFEAGVGGSLAWIVAVVSIATFLGLTLALRAPVIALKAVVLNLLVAAAAIGATVLVFQDGIGRAGTGSLFPTVPVVAFGATFGIGMDYELFLLGAFLRGRREGLSDDDAIVQSLVRSGALVTRAAAIMLALFVGFALSDLMPLAMVGFALAVGVFLDATLVRLAMAPALLRLAGRWNWWPRA